MTEETVAFIVDDDPYIRESLQELLRSVGQRALAFDSTQRFLDAARPEVPSCMVLDVRLPGRSGLEFQQEMRKAGILIPVIVITGHGDVPMSVAAMKAGAIEFLMKPFRDQDFIDAVQRGINLDKERLQAFTAIEELRARHRLLSPREQEVFALVVAGRLNKQIAAELSVSEITVKVHRAQVMRKMQADSLPDLVRIAAKLEIAATK